MSLGDGVLHMWRGDLSLEGMAIKKNPEDNGRLSGDSAAASGIPAAREPKRNGHLFAAETQKVVTIEGITVEGVMKEMQIAYQTLTEKGTNDTCGVKRWRRVFRERPDRFMKILESLEKKMEVSKEANRKYSEEYEARGKRITELETENAGLQTKIAELEAKLGDVGEDEYAEPDPAVERLRELREKLAKRGRKPQIEAPSDQ